MLEVLLGASGGVFGIVGALAKQFLGSWAEARKATADLEVLREKNRHEALIADKRMEEIRLEAENAVKLAELTAAREVETEGFKAMTASYGADKATYSSAPTDRWMIFVDAVRGLTRPVLTIVFSGALLGLTFWMWQTVPAASLTDPVFLKETFFRLVDSVIFLATAAVGWWFAAREVKK